MTDDQIIDLVARIDTFLIEQGDTYKVTPLDMSALINSRLRVLNEENGTETDYDELLDHLIGQTIIYTKTIH